MEENTILSQNLVKWDMLPAGKQRESVNNLLTLSTEAIFEFYRKCIEFWQKERGWEYERYSELFLGRSVLEIGSGLGYDGITYSKSVRKWTFCDIMPQNLAFIKKVAGHLEVKNIYFQLIEDVFEHDFKDLYDGFYAHGVLHHVPFEVAQKEVRNIDKFLLSGSKVVLLMYPYERWEMCGRPSFEEFGCMTDGEGTPWAEFYDEEKLKSLFGDGFELLNETKWGYRNSEFVNYELIKK